MAQCTIIYHLVRECIVAEIIYFIHIEGKFNPSDLFTKILGWAEFWPVIQVVAVHRTSTTMYYWYK
jgi:hypothetical protein